MWDYTNSVMKHFKNPQNVGKLDDANGIGQVGSLACGDALTLYLKINTETEIIEKASFQTFGCASAIASASALTELVKNKSIDEAKKITNDDIATFLGGLPNAKMHCSVMGAEALEAAIANYKGEEIEEHEEEVITCTCFMVNEDKIIEAIKKNGLKTVTEVTDYTKAGGGCGSCIPNIEALIDMVNNKKSVENSDDKNKSEKRLTNIQKFKMITEVIEKDIKPVLNRDGGNIELIDIEGNNVIVELQGSCAGCAGSKSTLKNIVQEKLRSQVLEELVVVEA